MYLSRLILNPRSRQVQREVADCYQLHRTVLQAFAPSLSAEERVLYRLETGLPTGGLRLLVQSRFPPNWAHVAEADGAATPYLMEGEDENPAVKEFAPQLAAGQELLFRLVANPSLRRPAPAAGEKGKRLGLLREEEQVAWLARKGEGAGFRLLDVRVSPARIMRGRQPTAEGKRDLSIVTVQFDGLLRVQDPCRLAAAVAEGIGSAKGFGCGLLSLARGL